MSKHTPEPWIVGLFYDGFGWPCFRLRDVNDPGDERGEILADVRLIQAAPELYQLLKQAETAIASLPKGALGWENVGEGMYAYDYPLRDELLDNIRAGLARVDGENDD